MKIVFLFFSFSLVLFQKSQAQYLQKPVSIVYNENNSTYYIANAGCGEILSLNDKGEYKIFAKGLSTQIKDMEIVDEKLFVCDGSNIAAYQLSNASLLFNKNIGAKALNGLTAHGDYLYAADQLLKKIYRISSITGTATIFLQDTEAAPTAMRYDAASHSLHFLTADSPSKIMRVGMITKDVAILSVAATSKLNAICNSMDQVAITSEMDNAIYFYDTDLSSVLDTISMPEVTSICYNAKEDVFVAVSATQSSIEFIKGENLRTSALNQLNIYPNLNFYFSTSKNKVTLKDEHRWTQYYLYDLQGNNIEKGAIVENEFELNIQKKGMFIVKCTSENETGIFKMYKL